MTAQLVLQVLDDQSNRTRTQMIDSMANLREAWEIAANGESLLQIQGSVGLILHDFAVKPNLMSEERQILLAHPCSRKL